MPAIIFAGFFNKINFLFYGNFHQNVLKLISTLILLLMKIRVFITCFLFFSFVLGFSPAFAIDDENKIPPAQDDFRIIKKENIINKKNNWLKFGEILKDDVVTLDETIDGDSIEGVRYDDDDELDFKLFAEKTFADKKAIKFERGFVNEISGELRFQGVASFDDVGRSRRSATYPFDINAVIQSKFGDNKYRFFTEYAFARDVSDLSNEFFGKFSNLYVERYINQNNKIRIGVSRSPIGLEGSMSSFSLPFANRAQISREFGDAISTGVSLIGYHKGFEYNLGGYSSTRFTQGFKDGAEFIGRIGYAPFYNQEGSYFRDLKFYIGSDVGHRHENYGVYSAAMLYEYKKFIMNFEYAYADGSNGDYFDPRKRQGFFTTIGWNFTPKLQLLFRYDYFDRDTNLSNAVNHEYTLGLNYFIFKQRLKFALNYVFSDDELTGKKSNGIYFLTQFFI